MTDTSKRILPEHAFKKLTWRSTLSLATQIESFTTWTVTGVAAMTGILVANLDAIEDLVSKRGLQAAFVFFTLSLLFGVVGKQLGMAVTSGVNTLKKLDQLLSSDEGQRLMSAMAIEPEQLVAELAEPFWWPLSKMILSSGKRGLKDYLASDKRLVRLFCGQLYLILAHTLAGATGILVLALSFRP